MASFILKDTNPQYGGQNYFVGTRKMTDPHGHMCEAADFGDKADAKKFSRRSDAQSRADVLNRMAGKKQFVVEEVSIYNQKYGQFRGIKANADKQPSYGGFRWKADDGGYNGF